ncbi:restriction endonuclease subunit S [Streptomyces sp. NBC_00433]
MSAGGIPSELPKGWARVRLGDLFARIEAGKSYTCEPRPALSDEWGVIKVSAMTWGEFDEAENKAVPIGFAFNPDYEIQPGDILLSRANTAAYVGASVLVRKCRPRLLLSDKSLRLIPAKGIDREWLAYLLSSPVIRSQISKQATGTKDSMRNISQRVLGELNCLLPPLEEQRRIVAALEEQLSRLDAAIGNAARVVRTAGTLIHAVKARAVRDLSDRYPSTTLGEEIGEPLRNGHSARAAAEGTVRILTLTAVTKGVFNNSYTKLTAADPKRISSLWLRSGDVLVQRSNTPDLVGTSALYEGSDNWAIFPDLLIRVRTSDRLDPHFAQLVLSAPQARQYFRSEAKGLAGSMPKIDQETILNTPLPLPDLEIQRQTVRAVSQVVEQATHAAATAGAYQAKSTTLRRSLLAEAFAGRLVPQDPADEPAEVLLARIRAAQETARETRKSQHGSPRRTPAQRSNASGTAASPAAHPPPPTGRPPLTVATQPTLDLEITS